MKPHAARARDREQARLVEVLAAIGVRRYISFAKEACGRLCSVHFIIEIMWLGFISIMTPATEKPTRCRRVQFGLAALLAVVTAVCVLLSVGRWLGWDYLAFPALIAYIAGLGVVTFLPLVIVLMKLSSKFRNAIGMALVVAGYSLANNVWWL